MEPSAQTNLAIEQFAHGKLIDGDRDVRGYTVVARSPGAPNDEWISRIRAQADVGDIYDLDKYAGSDAAFAIGDYVVAARFRRSPKRYDRGYFVQEHYLVMPRRFFAALGNNYSYLLSLLPATIPMRSHDEALPPLSVPPRVSTDEVQRAARALQQYGEQILQALQLTLDNHPFVIVPSRDVSLEDIWAFLETLTLLLPAGCRQDISWAINVMNARRNQARVKTISDYTTGTEGHAFIRLGMTAAQTLPPASESARTYVNWIRHYRARFPGNVAELLGAIEPLGVLPNRPKPEFVDPAALWKKIGPLILEHDWLNGALPDPKNFYDNLLPMLDEADYNLSPEQRSRFLVAVVKGALDGLLQTQNAKRVPRDKFAHGELLWQGLAQIFAATGTEPHDNNRWKVFATWREDQAFWMQPHTQYLLDNTLCCDVDALAAQPEQALAYLRQRAANWLVPYEVQYQANLLNRALVGASPQAAFQPNSLVMTWVDMAMETQRALQVARAVPSLATLLWQDPTAQYTYILRGLSGADSHQIDQALSCKSTTALDAEAELLLATALMGERLRLTGFRSSQVLSTITRQSSRLAPERLATLLDYLDAQIAALSQPAVLAVVGLMFATGQAYRFKRLLAADWHWIDVLVSWLQTNSASTPGYRDVIGVAIEWFQTASAQVEPGERNKRLREVLGCWVRITRGTLEAINNELTVLLLRDAFSGIGEASSAQGVGQQVRQALANLPLLGGEERELLRRVAQGIRFVHDTLFTGRPPTREEEEAYCARLTQAFAVWSQSRPRQTGKLLNMLKREGLNLEARGLSEWNIQKRGTEILTDLSNTLQQASELSSHLEDLLEEVDELTPERINVIVPDATQRAQWNKYLVESSEQLDRTSHSLRRFQSKMR